MIIVGSTVLVTQGYENLVGGRGGGDGQRFSLRGIGGGAIQGFRLYQFAAVSPDVETREAEGIGSVGKRQFEVSLHGREGCTAHGEESAAAIHALYGGGGRQVTLVGRHASQRARLTRIVERCRVVVERHLVVHGEGARQRARQGSISRIACTYVCVQRADRGTVLDDLDGIVGIPVGVERLSVVTTYADGLGFGRACVDAHLPRAGL